MMAQKSDGEEPNVKSVPFEIGSSKVHVSRLRLKGVFRIICYGTLGVGKSTLLADLIRNIDEYYEGPALTPLYAYNSFPPENLPSECLTFKGLPSVEDILDLATQKQGLLLVLDDLVGEK